MNFDVLIITEVILFLMIAVEAYENHKQLKGVIKQAGRTPATKIMASGFRWQYISYLILSVVLTSMSCYTYNASVYLYLGLMIVSVLVSRWVAGLLSNYHTFILAQKQKEIEAQNAKYDALGAYHGGEDK